MKKKLFMKVCGIFLSFAIGCSGMPAHAAQEAEAGNLQSEVSENTISGSEGEPVKSIDLEKLMQMDWKAMTDQEINQAIEEASLLDAGIFLKSLDEEAYREILARDTLLGATMDCYTYTRDGSESTADRDVFVDAQIEKKPYYEMALEEVAKETENQKAKFARSSGKFKLELLHQGNDWVDSAYHYSWSIYSQILITGINTSIDYTSQRDTVTLALPETGSYNTLAHVMPTSLSTTSVALSKAANGNYTELEGAFIFSKPAGYTAMYSGNDKVGHTMNMSYGNGSSAPSTDVAPFRINIITNAYVGTTASSDYVPRICTYFIDMKPATYNVVYNGNGATAGGVEAQSGCSWDGVYTTQTNQFTRAYTVTCDSNGGQSDVGSLTSSYRFSGWGVNNAETATIGENTAFSQWGYDNAVVTCYAIWDKSQGIITLPAASRKGYRFDGWNTAQGRKGIEPYLPTQDERITAIWIPNEYRIAYYDGMKSERVGVQTFSYDEKNKLMSLQELKIARPGYTFSGWKSTVGNFLNEALVQNLTDENTATLDFTATWTANKDTPYTVNRYVQKELDSTEYVLYDKEETADQVEGTQIFRGTTDANIPVIPDAIEGYKTPDVQRVTIAGDGSTVVDFYFDLVDQRTSYKVNHYYQTSVNGEYILYDGQIGDYKEEGFTSTFTGEAGDGVTPSVNTFLMEHFRLIYPTSELVKPQLQSITLTKNNEVNYYYKMVSYDLHVPTEGGTTVINNYGLSEQQLQQLLDSIEEGSTALLKIDGVTYSLVKNADGTLTIKLADMSGLKVVTIPSEITLKDHTYAITEIYKECFKNNTTLEKVIIGNNVTSIGNSAFEGCTSLKEVAMNKGLINIGEAAFKDCTSLRELKLPDTLQTIGDNAFMNCRGLETISLNEGLLQIGNKAFYDCRALSKIVIPKTVLKIGSYAFGKCEKLKTLTFAPEAQLLSLGTGVFANCIVLGQVKVPAKLTSIPVKAFYNCKKLKNAVIGGAVTKIGSSAFMGCVSLKRITIPSKVQNIGGKAFYNCKQLKKVTIKSKALTGVGAKAFKKCKSKIRFAVPGSKKKTYTSLLRGKY